MGSYDTGGLRPPESVRKSCAAADGPYVAAMPVRRKLTLSSRDEGQTNSIAGVSPGKTQ